MGGVAQLGERRLCKPEVRGSIPLASISASGQVLPNWFASLFVAWTITAFLSPSTNAQTVQLSISPETTWIEQPRDAEGHLDYVAAVNERGWRDRTKEQNAARTILPLLSSHDWIPDHRRRVFAELGVEPAVETISTAKEFAEGRGMAVDELDLELKACAKTLWRGEQHPAIDAWLKSVDGSLDGVCAGLSSEYFFVPFCRTEPEQRLLDVDLYYLSQLREVGLLLAARGLQRIDAGDAKTGWDDLLSVQRLGRLVNGGSTLVDGLVSVSIFSTASEAARVALAHSHLADANWEELSQRWDTAYDGPQLKLQFENDHLAFLELIYDYAKAADPAKFEPILEFFDTTSQMAGQDARPVDNILLAVHTLRAEGDCDFDAALRSVNQSIQKHIAVFVEEQPHVRVMMIGMFQHEFDQQLTQLKVRLADTSNERTPAVRGELICGIVHSLMMPDYLSVYRGHARVRENRKVVQIALHLRALQQSGQLTRDPEVDLKRFHKNFDLIEDRNLNLLHIAVEDGPLIVSASGLNMKHEEPKSMDAATDDFTIVLPD